MDNNKSKLFETYTKSTKIDQGKDYEYLMCTFYALKLSTNENVTDFRMTTNDEKYGAFDDISLKVKFSNGSENTFLFQLKYKEEKSFKVNNQTLESINSKFSIKKCLESFEDLKHLKNIVYILSTIAEYNNTATPTSKKNDAELKVAVSESINFNYGCGLLNCGKNGSYFQFDINQNKDSKIDQFCAKFYLLSQQADIRTIRILIEEMVKREDYDISARFVTFMKEWSQKTYVLTKSDVIAKVIELSTSPWIQTLTSEKCNDKFQLFANAVMNFQLTTINSTKDTINKIWSVMSEQCDYDIILQKYVLNAESIDKERTIALWYLNKVPLIVRVDKSNKKLCEHVFNLLKNCVKKRRIVFLGEIEEDAIKSKENVFQNLLDLSQDQTKLIYDKIIHDFGLSLQGRQQICLNKLLECDTALSKFFTTNELLQMSENCLFLYDEQEQERLPEVYIKRNVSTIFLNTIRTVETFAKDRSCLLIFNCEETFKVKLRKNFDNIDVMEVADYLRTDMKTHSILVATKNKCSSVQFQEACRRTPYAYLLQVVNDDDSILLLRKGNKLSTKLTSQTIQYREGNVKEEDIFRYFDNPLNIFIAPPGIGKSTLLSFLSQKCPSRFWCVRVNLINHIPFLKNMKSQEEMLLNFLGLEDANGQLINEVKKSLWRNKKIHIFLDGLDEVDSQYVYILLDFVQSISSSGVPVWVSSRENLKKRILGKLNIMPIAIQELTKNQQKVYIERRLEGFYNDLEISRIISAIFRSKDIPCIEQLLGIPLQLYIITENFRKNKSLVENLDSRDNFVLTKIYKLFFDGKEEFQKVKTGTSHIATQIGFNFDVHLDRYEIPAVKSVLNSEEFARLDVDYLRIDKMFSEKIIAEGDKFGIIKQISKDGQAVYTHQTFAEYFACLWFSKNPEKVRILRDNIFSEKYDNLRYIFDIMLAEKNPLHLAIIYKSLDLFNEHFEERGEKDSGGRSALHLACCYGNKYPLVDLRRYKSVAKETQTYTEMVKKLLIHCEIFEEDTLFGFECLDYAARSHCLYVVEMFLEIQTDAMNLNVLYHEYKSLPLLAYYSSELGYACLLSAIVTKNPDVALFKKTYIPSVLKVAVMGSRDNEDSVYNSPKEENVKTVGTFLERTKEIVKKERSWANDVLDLACENGWYDIIELLLAHGGECSDRNTILHITAHYNKLDEKILQLAKDNNIDVNSRNGKEETALHLACEGPNGQGGKIEIVKMLLEHGADLEALTNNNSNMLHCACKTYSEENTSLLELLIKKGVSINNQNDDGEFPLYVASRGRSYANTETLLDNGAEVNATCEEKKAASFFYSQISEKLLGTRLYADFLKNSSKVKTQHCNGQTALHAACETDYVEVAELLLKRGARPDVLFDDDDNMLHYLLRNRKVSKKIIELLLEHGISINSKNNNGETAFHIACENGHGEIVRLFLEDEEGDVNAITDRGMSLLHYASRNPAPNIAVINLLVARGMNVNLIDSEGNSSLHLAWKLKSFSNVKTLLQLNADVNHVLNQTLPLHYILKHSESYEDQENSEVLNVLISNNSVNAKDANGKTPLHIAYKHGLPTIVKILLDRGADEKAVTKDKMSALHYAVKTNSPNKSVLALLKGRIDFNVQNSKGKTPLHLSCQYGSFENVQTLLNNGAKHLVTYKEKRNALHYAVTSSIVKIDIVKLLINSGIRVNAQDCQGKTPLHFACEKGTYKIAKLLLDSNIDVNLPSNEQKTILHYAVESKNNKLINKILTKKEMDVNFLDSCKWTALHYAVLANDSDHTTINLLIKSGVDVFLEDVNGDNALDLAFRRGCYEAVHSLLQTGLYLQHSSCNKIMSLYYSVYSGCSLGVEMFLEKAPDTNGVDVNNEEFPLYFVSKDGCLERNLLLKFTEMVRNCISNIKSDKPVSVLNRVVEYLKREFPLGDQKNFDLEKLNLGLEIVRKINIPNDY